MIKYFCLAVGLISILSCGGEEFNGLSPKEYVEANGLDAMELDKGVYSVVYNAGGERKPVFDDVIEFNYTGKLTDGTEFDKGEAYRNYLSSLIDGFEIGLKDIGIGGSCTLIIPPSQGYGNQQVGQIPANSTLIFDVDLLNIYNIRTIDEYIADNNLTTTELDKGVHIVIKNPGNSTKPILSDKIKINYTGYLTNTYIFDQGTNTSFTLSNLIEGWQIGLQEIGEGGSCTLIIPPAAGYGSNSTGDIPPNSVLVFEIDLLQVN